MHILFSNSEIPNQIVIPYARNLVSISISSEHSTDLPTSRVVQLNCQLISQLIREEVSQYNTIWLNSAALILPTHSMCKTEYPLHNRRNKRAMYYPHTTFTTWIWVPYCFVITTQICRSMSMSATQITSPSPCIQLTYSPPHVLVKFPDTYPW